MYKIFLSVGLDSDGKYVGFLCYTNTSLYIHRRELAEREEGYGGIHYANITNATKTYMIRRMRLIQNCNTHDKICFDTPEEALCNFQRLVSILHEEDLEDLNGRHL